MIFEEILYKENKTLEELEFLLAEEDGTKEEQLFNFASKVRDEKVGRIVYFRGIIEFSNKCNKNCYYCGIRASNRKLERYELTDEEILECAVWAYKNNYGSIVLQSGECQDKAFVDRVVRLIKRIKEESIKLDVENKKGLGITLCVGEQTRETYERFFEAGAHRYLLRIETSNPDLYRKLHPKSHSYEKRVECLKILKSIGYQVGTGVMIGLPGQTYRDLAKDIQFFKDIDADMIGMGPYIVHKNTPLYKDNKYLEEEYYKNKVLKLSLRMIAVTRIYLPDINIASTTALQALDDVGREKGLMAGANVIMPVLTPKKYRRNYLLYENKPCIDEDALQCKDCLSNRVKLIGLEIGFNKWGDSKHFIDKNKKY